MPILGNEEQHNLIGSNFGFSAVGLRELDESEYTLVTLVQDESTSVTDFQKDMEKCLGQAVEACRHSPRANNLLLRVLAFNQTLREIHGFKELKDCNPDDYLGCLDPNGLTAIYDATENAIEATLSYGSKADAVDIDANGLVIVITDGDDNMSTSTLNTLKQLLKKVHQQESLQSLNIIVVGVNMQDPYISDKLNSLKTVTSADQFVILQDASPKTLAKLAQFVSRSISSVSQSLASGQAANLGSLSI